LNILEYLFNG